LAPTIATPSNALIALDAKPHYVTEIFVADAARHWHELDVAICFACIEENVVQIDPVNDNVRVFKPLHERCAGRDPRDYPTINRIKHKQRVGNNRLLQYRFADAQAIKHVESIRPKLDAVGDNAEFWSLLNQANAKTLTGQSKCNGGAPPTRPPRPGLDHARSSPYPTKPGYQQ
jgi:hypothetical protein